MRPRHVDEASGRPAAGHPLPMLDVLDLLGFWRSSGKIEITAPDESFSLHVDRGRILAASSSLRTLRLGHLLLQRGAVEPVYLHDVLYGRRTVPRERALGAALLDEGAITQNDLAATIEEQIIEVLARAIAIQDSTVLMIADDPVPAGIEPVDLDTAALIAEANDRHARRAAVRAMQRLLPRHDARLELTVQLPLVSYKLADAELLVALQVDKGGMTLDRLSGLLPLDPIALKRAVINLVERGYLAAVFR